MKKGVSICLNHVLTLPISTLSIGLLVHSITALHSSMMWASNNYNNKSAEPLPSMLIINQ